MKVMWSSLDLNWQPLDLHRRSTNCAEEPCTGTPQPLYNTIVGVQSINRVSYTTVLYKKKCIDYIEKKTIYGHFSL